MLQLLCYISLPLSEIYKITTEAAEVFKVWKSSYFEVREKIETGSKGQRWEFDRRRLFNETDYYAKVLNDLSNVVKVILHQRSGKISPIIASRGGEGRGETSLPS